MIAPITVKGQTEKLEIESPCSLLDLLLKAQSRLWKEDEAISAVVIDGERLDQPQEEMLGNLPYQGQPVEIILDHHTPSSIETTVENAMGYCRDLADGFSELADQIRIDPRPERYGKLKDGLQGLLSILDLLEILQSVEGIPEEIKDRIEAFMLDLKERTQEMNEAQVERDHILVADMLEYEFADGTRNLASILESLNLHLSKRDSSESEPEEEVT